MKTVLGNKVVSIVGYSACILSLISFFSLIYLGLFTGFKVKLSDIIICIVCAIIFFTCVKIKGKQNS